MALQTFYVKASIRGTARGATVPPQRWASDKARPGVA
jgi:hypothetical protein